MKDGKSNDFVKDNTTASDRICYDDVNQVANTKQDLFS